jgi:hypothetical protein
VVLQAAMLQLGTNVTRDWTTTNLFKWLNKTNAALALRVEMIREEQAKWLPYVCNAFPHYPSHAIDHSDRIVAQLSRLLFREGAGKGSEPEPVTRFSAAEVYCLLCSAYLHDMGMVVSPGEQAEILASEAWKSFVAEGGRGHDAYTKYSYLRTQASAASLDKDHFLADAALRYVIADFVRRDHHERGIATLQMHDFLKRLVDDGDSVAFNTIASICVGHGLADREIGDKDRFPEERDVFGEKVNVRFLARLLRIGDLLDLDTRRADPMSAKAVGPLPPDAVPHWRQYSTKQHENITPDAIEFRFECKDQDTHRILRDWFGWLEAEVRATAVGQLRARRHGDWIHPRCEVASQPSSSNSADSDQSTIIIRPAKDAAYKFHDWRIEMDQQAVLDLLIRRVYEYPLVFIRELIQNALDATRCRMYSDFQEQNPGQTVPERPTQFPADFRHRYPLRLSLKHESVKLTPDGPTETRPVFTIEDCGTGMDERIITGYFLQVGRSYYQSTEFRKRFSFAPTSRFGIGFLSVFAVSKNVTVETAHRDSVSGLLRGIRLELREPRNYLLTENWRPFERRPLAERVGTRIRIVMDHWPEDASLNTIVKRGCVSVEVPIFVEEAESTTLVQSKPWEDGMVLAESKVDPKGRFLQRVFNVDRDGLEGQLALVAYKDEQGEGWCDCWSDASGLDGRKLDSCPEVGESHLALHGIATGARPLRQLSGTSSSRWVARLDCRTAVGGVPLSRSLPNLGNATAHSRQPRSNGGADVGTLAESVAADIAQEAVSAHLATARRATGPLGIYYLGAVLTAAPVSQVWRTAFPGTVVTWRAGSRVDCSVADLLAMDELDLAVWASPVYLIDRPPPPIQCLPQNVKSSVPIVAWGDLPDFVDGAMKSKLHSMNLLGVERHADLYLLRFSACKSDDNVQRAHPKYLSWFAPLSVLGIASLIVDPLKDYPRQFHVFDKDHPISQWLIKLRKASLSKQVEVDTQLADILYAENMRDMHVGHKLLQRWIDDPEVLDKNKPPMETKGRLIRCSTVWLASRRSVLPAATRASPPNPL